MIRGGALKAIALASDRRFELLPDVPTFRERGLDYRTGTWFGLLAPARTPPETVGALNRTAVSVLQEQGVRARLAEQGAEVIANSPAEFCAFIGSETERLSKVLTSAHIIE